MKILNKNHVAAYEQEKEMLEQRHKDAMADLESRKPQPISVSEHPENEAPKTLPNGVIVIGGMLYGKDFTLHPDDVGKNGHWIKV